MLERVDITRKFGKPIPEFSNQTESIIYKNPTPFILRDVKYREKEGYLYFETIADEEQVSGPVETIEYQFLTKDRFIRRQSKFSFKGPGPFGEIQQRILQYYENTDHGEIITQYLYDYTTLRGDILILKEGDKTNTPLAKINLVSKEGSPQIHSIDFAVGEPEIIQGHYGFAQLLRSTQLDEREYFHGIRISMEKHKKIDIQDMRIGQENKYINQRENFSMPREIHLTNELDDQEYIVTVILGEENNPHVFKSINSKDNTSMALFVTNHFYGTPLKAGLAAQLQYPTWKNTYQEYPVTIFFS